jgi:hypothetical protein
MIKVIIKVTALALTSFFSNSTMSSEHKNDSWYMEARSIRLKIKATDVPNSINHTQHGK